MTSREVFISSVGLYAQLVTLTLDLLLQRPGQNVTDVVVLHTRPDPAIPPYPGQERRPAELMDDCLATLRNEFSHGRYRDDVPFELRLEPITQPDGRTLFDVRSPSEIDAFWGGLFRTVRAFKARDYRVHLSVAAGRKPMALAGLSIAQLLLQPDDYVWNLQTDVHAEQGPLHIDELVDGRPFEVNLVQIPFVPAQDQVLVIFADEEEGPKVAARMLIDRQSRHELKRLIAFMKQDPDDHHPDNLTPAEARIAELAARNRTNQEIAYELSLSMNTVRNTLSEDIYPKLASRFELDEDWVRRPVLANKLRPYLEWLDSGAPPLS